jgi:CO/xanthine dehydrogenase Mo-binding subunit
MRIISPYVGGGFGAKAGTTIEGIIIPLAMHSKGRPVMMEYTREEEFVNSYVRQGLYTKIKTAVRKSDGKFGSE